MQREADIAAVSVDQRSGQMNEPDRQGNNGQMFREPERLTAHTLAFVPTYNLAQDAQVKGAPHDRLPCPNNKKL